MKRLLALSTLWANLFGATQVYDFAHSVATNSAQEAFNKLLDEHTIVVVKCLKSYCTKCAKAAPAFERLADTYHEKALFVDLDVHKFYQITDSFNLRSVPTFLIFIKGKLYRKIRGSGNVPEVAKQLSKAITSNKS